MLNDQTLILSDYSVTADTSSYIILLQAGDLEAGDEIEELSVSFCAVSQSQRPPSLNIGDDPWFTPEMVVMMEAANLLSKGGDEWAFEAYLTLLPLANSYEPAQELAAGIAAGLTFTAQ